MIWAKIVGGVFIGRSSVLKRAPIIQNHVQIDYGQNRLHVLNYVHVRRILRFLNRTAVILYTKIGAVDNAVTRAIRYRQSQGRDSMHRTIFRNPVIVRNPYFLKLIIMFMLGFMGLTAQVFGARMVMPSAPKETRISPKTSSSYASNPRKAIGAIGPISGSGDSLQGWAPGPLGLAITPDGKTAYVSFSLDDSLLVVNLATLTISDSIDVSAAGIQLDSGSTLLSPDGRKLYVSNYAAQNVMVVDTINKQVVKVLPVSPASLKAMSLSPDGSKIYVPSSDQGGLCVISTADDSYQRIAVAGVLFGPIAPSRNNPNLLYTVGTLINQSVFQTSFFAFDVVTQKVVRSMSFPNDVIQYPAPARRIVLNSSETAAYFGWFQQGPDNKGIGNMVAFDLNNFQVAASAPADYGVADFTVNEAAGRIYVIGLWSGGGAVGNVPILEWDMAANKFVRNIPLSSSSDQRAVVVDPSNSDFLFETDGDYNVLRKVRISTGNEVGSMRFNKDSFKPYAIIRGGNIGYVVSYSSQAMYKLDLGSGQLVGRVALPVAAAKGWGFYQDKFYISSGSDILALNPSSGSISQRYPIGRNINPIIFTFFGDRMAAINFDPGTMQASQLFIFDARTMVLLKSIPLPLGLYSDKVVASPDGSKLYIARGHMWGDATVVTIFNATTLEEIRTIEIPPAAQRHGHTGFMEGEFDEANRILYLLGFASVYKIDMDTDQLIDTFDLIDVFTAMGRSGWFPSGLAGVALSPSKDKLFVVSGDAHSLYAFDVTKSSWTTRIVNLKGFFVTDGVLSPDRRFFYTANSRTDNVSMIDLNTGELIKVIDLKSALYAPLDPAGQKVLNRSLSQAEYINVISFKANPDNVNILNYNIYLVENGQRMELASLDANTFKYLHRSVTKDAEYTYHIVAVNKDLQESDPAVVVIR